MDNAIERRLLRGLFICRGIADKSSFRLRDPGTDLAVIAALASAVRDAALEPGTAYLGEVALSGAIRPVQQVQRRLGELARLGFERCVVPATTPRVDGIELLPVRTLKDALNR